jgi:hypothetical protein
MLGAGRGAGSCGGLGRGAQALLLFAVGREAARACCAWIATARAPANQRPDKRDALLSPATAALRTSPHNHVELAIRILGWDASLQTSRWRKYVSPHLTVQLTSPYHPNHIQSIYYPHSHILQTNPLPRKPPKPSPPPTPPASTKPSTSPSASTPSTGSSAPSTAAPPTRAPRSSSTSCSLRRNS